MAVQISQKDLEIWAGYLVNYSIGGIKKDDIVMIKGESYRMRERQGLIVKDQTAKPKRGRPPKNKNNKNSGGDNND